MEHVGFVGLGAMGFGMAQNLVKAGIKVTAFDLRQEALDRFAEVGGSVAPSLETLMESEDIVGFCLAGSDMEAVSKSVLEWVRPGAVILDHATMAAPSTRRLHKAFAEKGAIHCDVAISGGSKGAAAGELKVFFGGEKRLFQELAPYLRAVANEETIFHAGGHGMGQVMKAVQNMSTWYVEAIRMEIIAYGLHSGLSFDQIRQVVANNHGLGGFDGTIGRIQGDDPAFKTAINAEFDYFLEETKENSFPMPAMRGLMDYLNRQERDTVDFVHRRAHNLWKRFMLDGANKAGVPAE